MLTSYEEALGKHGPLHMYNSYIWGTSTAV